MLCYHNTRNMLKIMKTHFDKKKESLHPLVLLLDGGVSTHLESMQRSHSFPDRNLWSSSLLTTESGQSDIQKAHEDFYASGSNIVTTVTYQLSYHAAENFGYEENDIDEMLKKAVDLANQARLSGRSSQHQLLQPQLQNSNQSRFVMASAGCYGAVLADGSEYTGNYNLSIQQLIAFHKRRIQVFSKLEIDGIAFETIPSLEEVKAVVQLIKELVNRGECKGFIWLSLACQDSNTLNDGTSLDVVLQAVNKMDPDGHFVHGIGVNCCKVKYIHELAANIARQEIGSSRNRAIVLYPNSGEEWDAKNESWLEGTGCTRPNDFAVEIMNCIRMIHGLCIEHNVPLLPIIVGGCCRTTTSSIKALRAAVDEYLDQDKSL